MVTDAAPKSVTILGATGSVGTSTVDVLAASRAAYRVEAVTANTDAEKLAAIAREVGARLAVVADESAYRPLKAALAGSGVETAAGAAAVVEAARRPADVVVAAIVGAAGLAPTYAAVAEGRTVALANKECLVSAGSVFAAMRQRTGATLLPVDSEHNAIFQILDGRARDDVDRIVLTASGGPFRTWTHDHMARVTPADALRHPNWSMGAKITVDSATMMNKGLEIIEAVHVFGIERERLDVLVHPESIVHGLVEFCDGAQIAALSAPDMRAPIAHCLAWPARPALAHRRLDLAEIGALCFERLDTERFPAFAVAMDALDAGGWATNVMSAANEVAVKAFLAGDVGFLEIAEVVADTVARAEPEAARAGLATIEDAVAVDAIGRRHALDLIRGRSAA